MKKGCIVAIRLIILVTCLDPEEGPERPSIDATTEIDRLGF
jgi:hypothetical protein